MSEYDQNELVEFLKQASKYNVLSITEEQELLIKYKGGCLKARDKLLNHNLRLILSILKKFRNKGLSEADLFQEGATGFLRALEKFEIARGYKLSTYATWWIAQRMSRAIQNKGRLIRIPIHIQDKLTKIKKKYRAYIEDNQEIPTSEELAELCGISNEEAKELGRYLQEIGSLDETAGEDENLAVLSYLACNEDAQPEIQIEESSNNDYLYSLINLLPKEDRTFIILKYGFLDHEEKTKFEMAELLNIPPNEIQKKENAILHQLRQLADRQKVNMESSNTYNLILTAIGPNKLTVLEYLKQHMNFSLKQIEVLFKSLPASLKDGLYYEDMRDFSDHLILRGATLTIVENS